MNSDLFYTNVFTALVFGSVVFLIAFALALYKQKPTYKNQPDIVVHKADFSSVNTQLDAERERIICQLKEQIDRNELLEQELTLRRTELTTTAAERDNYRGLWEQAVERNKGTSAQLELKTRDTEYWIDEYKKAIREREEARSLANDLREYLDRALELVNIQNEQIQQLLPVDTRRRDEKGRFVKVAVAHRKIDGNEPLFMQQIGRVERPPIRPEPVKHLRDVNAEILEASKPTIEAFQKVHKAVERLGGTGEQYNWMDEGLQSTEETRPDDSEAGEQAQPAELKPFIDWTKPVAFPKDYSVPRGTEVVVVLSEYVTVKRGYKGIVLGWFRDKAIVNFNELDLQRSMRTEFLAPINPTDHPLHPEFKSNS